MRLYHGDALSLLLGDEIEEVDALVTDPPYSSGGMFRSDRMAAPETKYVQHQTKIVRPTFSGDCRDQQSFTTWCTLWMDAARRRLKPAGYALVFTDWRQMPATTDALQCGGFVWRGIVSWDKTEGDRAPHTGYFRHQCEYVVWGTNGAAPKAHGRGPFPGAFRMPVRQAHKHHITGKPTELMQRLIECVAPGGSGLDPFAGSGTTLVAAMRTGRRAIGIEAEEACCEIAARRLMAEESTLAAAA